MYYTPSVDAQYDVAAWCNGRRAGGRGELIAIDTLEGTMYASPGDYVIKGVQGEFYPCKFSIFEATYEPLDELEGY